MNAPIGRPRPSGPLGHSRQHRWFCHDKSTLVDFLDAFGLWAKNWVTIAFGGISGGVFGEGLAASIAAGAVTLTLVAGAIALAIMGAIGSMFSFWAPADPIGLDFMVFENNTLWWLTDKNKPLPAGDAMSHWVLDPKVKLFEWADDAKGPLTTEIIPLRKEPGLGNDAAYFEEHRYRSSEENSHYSLTFRMRRVGPPL